MSDEVRSALVVTFSQTGNTERVAEAVGRGLRTGGVQVRHAQLLEARPEDAAQHDLVGIGTPVFYYHEPTLVARFIERLPRADRKPAFTFITHGGNPVNTLRRMQKQLAARGYVVVNSFSCHGYDTYPMHLRNFRQWGHPSGDDLAEGEDFGERLVNECRWFREERRFATPRYPFVGGKYFLLSLMCRGKRMKRMFPSQRVDEEVCTQCGACARHCPTGAITLDPFPKIDEKCVWCYQCERICPVQAYNVDWSELRRRMNA